MNRGAIMSVALKERGEMHPRRKADRGVRRCAATGRSSDKACLIRFVTAPDGSVVADIAGDLPGRGLWLSAERAVIERACRKGGALARAGRVAPDLPDTVERLLVARCQSLLGLARRAGQLAVGQDAVRAALRDGDTVAMVVARDAGADGRGKLERLSAAVARDVAVVDILDRAELGQAVGRASAVHLAVRAGRLATRFMVESGRLAGVRVAGPAQAPGANGAGNGYMREAERR